MQKFYLLSVVIATIAIPFWLATRRKPAVGLRQLSLYMFLFVAAWAIGSIYVYWRLPE